MAKQGGQPLVNYRGHAQCIRWVAWSPDGQSLATTSEDYTVQVWKSGTGQNVWSHKRLTPTGNVIWSPDGKRIAFADIAKGGGYHVLVCDAATGKVLLRYTEHFGEMGTIVWSPDGKYIASAGYAHATDEEAVLIWDANTGQTLHTYSNHGYDRINSVVWSPDSKNLISNNFEGIEVWDVATGRTVLTYKQRGVVFAKAWSPDGKRIASGSKVVEVWDAHTGQTLISYLGHSEAVYSLAWSPDGQYIVSGSADATAQVWDSAMGTRAFTYRDHADWVASVAWSPDGKCIVSGDKAGEVYVWVAGPPWQSEEPAHPVNTAKQEPQKSVRQWLDEGNAHGDAKRYEEAVWCYDYIITLCSKYPLVYADDPVLALVYSNRGMAYIDLKEYRRAVADLKRAIELNPQDAADSYGRLGLAYFRLREYKQAAINFGHAINRRIFRGGNYWLYIRRGQAYFELKNYRQALADYTSAIAAYPREAAGYYHRGNVYLALKKYRKALADYDKAVDLGIDHKFDIQEFDLDSDMLSKNREQAASQLKRNWWILGACIVIVLVVLVGTVLVTLSSLR